MHYLDWIAEFFKFAAFYFGCECADESINPNQEKEFKEIVSKIQDFVKASTQYRDGNPWKE